MNIEFVIGIIILLILGTFLNPTHLLMPATVNTMLILGLIIGFLAFIALIWRERADDERESLHIHKSGRISFLVGASILVIGVVSQALMHNIDAWLLYALSGMVLTKIISRILSNLKN